MSGPVARYPDDVTDRSSLVVGGITAESGTRAAGYASVDLGDGAGASVPVLLVHGAQPGPRVAVTAGIHGAEYVSIAALREVALGLDPVAVRGTLVAVLTASPVAFATRTIYVNPLDGLNLNRQFPGDPSGSPTQRLAHLLTTQVIPRSDQFVDMHYGLINQA